MRVIEAIAAQAALHHQFFLGLQLMVSVEEDKKTVYDWMFKLFRRQHEEKFLSSFEKLGLSKLPHAVACAQYHVISNGIGGGDVECMIESDNKAWVRFRYPRWLYAGPAICGVPIEASRGFLNGWYAYNGVSLGNPRLGFVCVSEDMTGQFGLCGYFKEYDRVLADHERLVFAPDEFVPAYNPADQLQPPVDRWGEERLAKAKRNYAMEYVRNALVCLGAVVGRERALELALRVARLTGLQHYQVMAQAVGASDGGPPEAAQFLCAMMAGMGDDCQIQAQSEGEILVTQSGLRIVRGLNPSDRLDLLNTWIEIWRGAIHSHRTFMDISCDVGTQHLQWCIRLRRAGQPVVSGY